MSGTDLLFGTISAEHMTPSQASILAMDLGVNCTAMDINAACTGFLYALDVADALFKEGKAEYVMVVGMDIMSRYMDYTTDNPACCSVTAAVSSSKKAMDSKRSIPATVATSLP